MSKTIPITCKSDQLIPITQLENFQGKLKAIDEQSFNKLKESIVKYGFSFPIFVWGKKILDGHQRLAAVKRLIDDGYSIKGDKLPIVDIIAKSEQEAAEKLLLINSRYARIDQSGFDAFIADFEIDLADFSGLLEIPDVEFDFDVAGSGYDGNTDPDEVPDVQPDIVSKRGDIWILGKHRLMCGDSTNIEDVEKLMNGEKADMVFTDPPYGIDLDANHINRLGDNGHLFYDGKVRVTNKFKNIINDNKHFDASFLLHYFEDTKEIFLWGANNFINGVKGGSWICWDKKITPELDRQVSSDFELAWSKNKHKYTMFRCTWTGCYGHNLKLDGPRKVHPTQKPIKLIVEIFNKPWFKDLDLCIDLYSGSGSILISCEKTNRKCYAMEISEKYVDVAVRRWQDFTGQQAVLESTGEKFNDRPTYQRDEPSGQK